MSLFDELKRRNVIRFGLAYLVSAGGLCSGCRLGFGQYPLQFWFYAYLFIIK